MQKCAHRRLLPHHMTYPSTISKHSFLQVTQTPSLSLVFLNLFLPFLFYFCVPHHHISTMFLSIVFSSFSQIIWSTNHLHHHLLPSLSPSPYIYFCSPPRAVRLVFLHSFLFLPFSPFPWFTFVHQTGSASPSPL